MQIDINFVAEQVIGTIVFVIMFVVAAAGIIAGTKNRNRYKRCVICGKTVSSTKDFCDACSFKTGF